MKRLVYIDLDGVLARWQLHEVSRQCGRTITEADWCPILGWDIVGVIAKLGGPVYKTGADFWTSVTEESWESTPKTDEFDTILDGSVDLVGRENVRICTAPPPDHNPAAYSGKAKWIKEHLPTWLHRNVIFTEHKHELATRSRLLIDDANHNVDTWNRETGPVILVPRPWNGLHGVDINTHLDRCFRWMGRTWNQIEAA